MVLLTVETEHQQTSPRHTPLRISKGSVLHLVSVYLYSMFEKAITLQLFVDCDDLTGKRDLPKMPRLYGRIRECGRQSVRTMRKQQSWCCILRAPSPSGRIRTKPRIGRLALAEMAELWLTTNSKYTIHDHCLVIHRLTVMKIWVL